MMRRTVRRAIALAGLAIGGFLVTFVAAEFVAWLVWELPKSAPPPTVPEAWEELPRLRSVYSFKQPNVRGLTGAALYESNSEGFRGRERSREKPARTFRIAVGGDSFTMGWGVMEEDTYAARIERALNARSSPETVEVLNFGNAGQGISDVVRRFHDQALLFDPDLLVYGFSVNDLEGESYRKTSTPLGVVYKVVITHPLYLWRVLAPRLGGPIELLLSPRGTYLYELDDNYFQNPEVWGRAISGLDRLAETLRQRDMCGVVLIHTRLHYLNSLHPYHRHYDAISDAAQERGLTPIPSVQSFLGRKDRDLWVHPDDPHPSPEAHAILADVLLEGLDALPERCWARGSGAAQPGSGMRDPDPLR